ncbi:hypothetical protein FRC15_007870 [Serendipita sp. 397]|nr:hypothetical protein FRC15_007870 [Serendipita sp. 397]
MSVTRLLLLGAVACIVKAHGGHDVKPDDGEWDAKSYAEQHMHKEHHMSVNTLSSTIFHFCHFHIGYRIDVAHALLLLQRYI